MGLSSEFASDIDRALGSEGRVMTRDKSESGLHQEDLAVALRCKCVLESCYLLH